MSRFLSTLWRSGKNKSEWGGSADERGTRGGYPFHERLTKNHDFLVQPTDASGIIGGRRALRGRAARGSHWRGPHPPLLPGPGGPGGRNARDAFAHRPHSDQTTHYPEQHAPGGFP